jgi:hypothetical protein
MTTQNISGVAHIVTHFNPLKYSILDFDNGFTGSTLGITGDTIPILVVTSAPSGAPPGGKGFVVQVTSGVVTFWMWDGTNWRSK